MTVTNTDAQTGTPPSVNAEADAGQDPRATGDVGRYGLRPPKDAGGLGGMVVAAKVAPFSAAAPAARTTNAASETRTGASKKRLAIAHGDLRELRHSRPPDATSTQS